MKEDMKDMFAQITMPEQTEQAIRTAMEARVRRQKRPVVRTVAALTAMLATVILLSPTARAAANQWMVKYFWPDSDITIYEVKDPDGEVEATVAVVDTEAPAFARVVNDRLYFLGNGEKIDITDEISEEKPYYYTYVDDYGMTHEMAVGYSGTIENFGIYEFIWKEEAGEKVWTAGIGRNFLNNDTGTRYPWVDTVWQDLNIPWSMPE